MALTRPRAAQVDFDVTNITDPLIRINSGQTGSNDKDSGIVIERGSDTNVALVWDESADSFAIVNTTEDGSTGGDISISSYADLTLKRVTQSEQQYTTSNMMKFNQYYLGNEISTYFDPNEYQKVLTITPAGDSENYQVSGRIMAQNAGDIHIVYFTAALRSNTLPDLSWSISYTEEYNGSRYIDPQLWTKETTTAGFIVAFKCLSRIYGTVTVDLDVVPRFSSLKANVVMNTSESSEQTTIDTGFTANDMTKVSARSSTNITYEGSITASSFVGDGSNLTGVVSSYGDSDVATYLSGNGYGTSSSIIASITDSAPGTLDTLNELAAALGDDANFSTTVTNSIATKLPLAGGTITGQVIVTGGDSPQISLNPGASNPWAIELVRNGVTASKVYNQAGYWSFEHEPRYYNGGTAQKIFHEGYHPNADTLTTARTINGVSFNGSANITIADSTKLPLAGGTMTGDLLIDSTDAEINLKAGAAGTSAALNWTFNTAGTNYASIKLPYDTRASTGLHIDSGYPITIDATTRIDFDISGTTYASLDTSGLSVGANTVFHDGYHPNADKWTTARTLSLSGDASGSVSWDGSANATLSVTVANDSHTHDGRYYTESEADSRFVNVTGDTMSGNLTVSKTDPLIRLYDSNSSTGTYPAIEFDTANNQGVAIELNEFDGELPVAGYGLVVKESSTNTQFPGTGTLSFSVLGDIYAGATSLGSLNKVFHDGYHPNADKWTTARTLSLSGDVTGSTSFDGSGNVSISATIAANSIALGTDTTGNYIGAGATSGNGISGSVSSEGGTFTVSSNATSANTASTIVYRDGSGNFSAGTITATATAAQYADLAEKYLADDAYPIGTVLEIGGDAEVTIASPDSYKIVGTISEKPGLLMNTGLEGENVVPVAYIGRVPCRVQGTIDRGDFLVVGNTPGVAVAKHPRDIVAGQAIGKALESYDSDAEGIIEILVGRL